MQTAMQQQMRAGVNRPSVGAASKQVLPSRRLTCSASANPFASGSSPKPEAQAEKPASKPLIDLSQKGVSRRMMVGSMALTVGLATCPCCPQPAKADAWNYDEFGRNWSGVCSIGNKQSPVNLPLSYLMEDDDPKRKSKFGDIMFKYGKAEDVEVFNTGHGTMQVNFQPGNIATVGGKDLELVQYHFHTPSEHSLDGRRWPMEVHLVHKVVGTDSLAVVGVMLDDNAKKANKALLLASVFAPPRPLEKIEAPFPLNPWDLLPAPDADGHRPYLHYAGSLTTPPCSEGVDWFVMTQPISCTSKQVVDFMRYVSGGRSLALNSRPLQKRNGRDMQFEL